MTCTYGTSGQEGPHYWADCVREEGIQAAHKFKRLNNSDLAAECRDGGWTATIHPVEVGCRGFVGKSAFQLLRAAGTAGISLRRATKELVKEAEKASYWLWLRRRDMNWGPSEGSCRGWLGDVPTSHCPPPPPGDVLDRGQNVSEWWHQVLTLQLTQRCTGEGAAGRNVKQETPPVYWNGYSHFIHFKTVATEVEIQFLSTWISLLPQFESCIFLF